MERTFEPLKITVTTYSGRETMKIGEKLGALISSAMSISLSGELGAGKTTFVQGMAKGLNVPDNYYVTSPTYTILNEYPGRIRLCHMDLYRLDSPDELDYIGFNEIVSSGGVIVIEWPELLEYEKKVICFDLNIILETDEKFNRKINLIASGLAGVNLLKNFSLI